MYPLYRARGASAWYNMECGIYATKMIRSRRDIKTPKTEESLYIFVVLENI